MNWEWFAIAVGGFTPVIAVGAAISTQELSKSSSHSSSSPETIRNLRLRLETVKTYTEGLLSVAKAMPPVPPGTIATLETILNELNHLLTRVIPEIEASLRKVIE